MRFLRAGDARGSVALTGMAALALLLTAGPGRAQETADEAQETAASPEVLARAAADAWLHLLDTGRFSESWESAAALFKEAVAKEAWEQQAASARAPFEPFGERQLLNAVYTSSLPNAPPGEYVVLQYQTAVSEGRSIAETVVPMKQDDGSWRVSGYFVKPNQAVPRRD